MDNSPAMKTAGIILTALGATSLAAGAILWVWGDLEHDDCRAGGGDCVGAGMVQQIGAVPTFIGAGAMLVTGVPLWIVGEVDAPLEGGDEPRDDASAVPTVHVGLGAVELRWAF